MRVLRWFVPMPFVVTVVAMVLAIMVLFLARIVVRDEPVMVWLTLLTFTTTAVSLAIWWFHVVIEQAPVSRERVQRFAGRHGLEVTATNGEQVIRYLATTRRWRAGGIAASLVLSIARPVFDGTFRIDFLTLFAGWFVGALIAEARVAHLAHGRRRAASLLPRRPTAYLPAFYWRLVPIAGGLSLAVAAACAVLALRGYPVPLRQAVGWAVAAAAVVIAVWGMQVYVLRRPQPIAPADVLAADDAIRSRSLHVLAGGGATLVVYCITGQVGAVSAAVGGAEASALVALAFLAVLIMPLYGWSVATRRWWHGGRRSGPASGSAGAPAGGQA